MNQQVHHVAAVRRRNQDAFDQALAGQRPVSSILADALALEDVALILECRICRIVALNASGDSRTAQSELEMVRNALENGAELSLRWRWTVEHVGGAIADEFSEFHRAWASHQAGREIAEEIGSEGLVCIGNAYLGYIHYRLNMREDALSRLFAVLACDTIPEQIEIIAHCLLGLVLSDMNEAEIARDHWDQAMQLVRQAKEQPNTAVLRSLVAVAVQTQDFSVIDADVNEWRRRSGARGPAVRVEADLWNARLAHHAGKNSEAISAVQSLLSRIDAGLAFRGEAVVLLVEILLAERDYVGVLVALDDPSLQPPPPLHELALVDARRRSLGELGRWEEATQCFDAARLLHLKRRLGSTSIYEIQVKAAEDRLLLEQTRELEKRNDELKRVVDDQATITELILNKIQSPLTSLQLVLDLFGADSDSGTSASRLTAQRVGLARRAVRRIDDVVLEIREAAALEGVERFDPEYEEMDLRDLLERIVLTQRSFVAECSMSLTLNWSGENVYVNVDPEFVHQLFAALIRGIVEFGARGATVEVSGRITEAGEVCVVIDCAELDLPRRHIRAFRLQADRPVMPGVVKQKTELSKSDSDEEAEAIQSNESVDRKSFVANEASNDSQTGRPDVASDLSFSIATKMSDAGNFGLRAQYLEPSGTSFLFVLGRTNEVFTGQ